MLTLSVLLQPEPEPEPEPEPVEVEIARTEALSRRKGKER
jgi:hypothetical protein